MYVYINLSCTYKRYQKHIGISDIDFLIADESHNLSSKYSTEGKKLAKTIKNYDDVKKLYFTATPSKEQEEHIIFEYTYLNGLKDEIMQPFDMYLQSSFQKRILKMITKMKVK